MDGVIFSGAYGQYYSFNSTWCGKSSLGGFHLLFFPAKMHVEWLFKHRFWPGNKGEISHIGNKQVTPAPCTTAAALLLWHVNLH